MSLFPPLRWCANGLRPRAFFRLSCGACEVLQDRSRCAMRALFLDANDSLAAILADVRRADDPLIDVRRADHVLPEDLPRLLDGYGVVLVDHTSLPTSAMQACRTVRHVVFLGTGARSYMDPDALAALGITVHTIAGYGDVAVAEHTVSLMWAAARGIARMDRDMRRGIWTRKEGTQLRGKTLGLIGFGGIAAEVARIAHGSGMRVVFWNRTPRASAYAQPAALDAVLGSDAVSIHLALNDKTRHFMSAARLAQMREGAILINTARAGIVDTAAMVAALESGRIGHAALDVFDTEPLPPGHPLLDLDSVTLSAHSGFCTPEASETLLRRALDIAREIATQQGCP